jgi:hypothetical protein
VYIFADGKIKIRWGQHIKGWYKDNIGFISIILKGPYIGNYISWIKVKGQRRTLAKRPWI